MAAKQRWLMIGIILQCNICMLLGMAIRRIVIPHDVPPGYEVTRFEDNGQKFGIKESNISKYFTVMSDTDRKHGVLVTTRDIQELINKPFVLVIIHEFPRETIRTETVNLFVLDSKKMLRFASKQYTGQIYENEPSGQIVSLDDIQLLTAAEDNSVNYKIISGNDGYAFSLRPKVYHGKYGVELITNDVLDREKKDKYELEIRASDAKDIDSATTKVIITLKDINDNAPIFEQSDYGFTIFQDTPRFTTVFTVTATDADGNSVTYKMNESHPVFAIIPKSGEIITLGELKLMSYEFSVLAFDNGNPAQYGMPARVHVEVTDNLNHNYIGSPSNEVGDVRRVKRADRPTITLDVKETEYRTIGQEVYTLQKSEGDTFEVVGGNEWIDVGASTGSIRVKKPFDYETLSQGKTIDFTVRIRNPSLHTDDLQRVLIRCTDVNDEVPYFVNRPLPMQTIVPLRAPEGTVVYKLEARDLDTNHEIHYILVRDQSNGRFTVDERSGEVRTRGTDNFNRDEEYIIIVKAEDRNGQTPQFTAEETLSIMGGRRPPQFYEPSYTANIPENKQIGTEVISVKAKSFADKDITYTMTSEAITEATFSIPNPTNGIVKLTKELDYEDIRQQKSYRITLTATESGGASNTAMLMVNIEDVNDEAPKFNLPEYQAWINEDVKTQTSILTVTATDADSGSNAQITYSINNNNFTILGNGIIYSAARLDADYIKKYEFIVTATDHGTPAKSGTATVRIFTKNTNDEPPVFSQNIYAPTIEENAPPNALVTTVVATDIDGDGVKYGFVDGGTRSGYFVIDENTGVIRLINEQVKFEQDKYELNVTATDDGTCCGLPYTPGRHTSTARVLVAITDVNDHKPVFPNCTEYNRHKAKVRENLATETYVITVQAIDEDKGDNGRILYNIDTQPGQEQRFKIDPATGRITTRVPFDREKERFVSITVTATDHGQKSLIGVCSFQIEIEDVNDNSPLFERPEYRETIKQNIPVGSNALRVVATDADADANGEVLYNLTASALTPQALNFFQISQDSGYISVKNPLPDTPKSYYMTAIATDKGRSPMSSTVSVIIQITDITNKPPVWVQNYNNTVVQINENVAKDTSVMSLVATSDVADRPEVFYELLNGNTAERNSRKDFIIRQRKQDGKYYADVVVNNDLDYESTNRYELHIQAKNNLQPQLASETTVFIQLKDVNDEQPLFSRQPSDIVQENQPPGTNVTVVTALDRDGTSPNNNVTYYLVREPAGGDWQHFNIDKYTGVITTNTVFDREQKSIYLFQVEAQDGAPSARPSAQPGAPNTDRANVRILIGDENDNAPYFAKDLYEAEVPENEVIGHTVITVTAEDIDEYPVIRYQITTGNIGGVFTVKPETGAIIVAGPLDYESVNKVYNLRLVASDGKNENHTNVRITVTDVNDIPPVFSEPVYEITINEEMDRKYLPAIILNVNASDGDTNRPQVIRYSLKGQGTDKQNDIFQINRTSGQIYVTQPLDRDRPNGQPEWTFLVLATDEDGTGLSGAADVKVKLRDINDNDPFFPKQINEGFVIENAPAGRSVMTMTATDYDDPTEGTNAKLTYKIERNAINETNGKEVFKIEPDTGIIRTAICCLDREKLDIYQIVVSATDGGIKKGSGTATVHIMDENDSPPKFTKPTYQISVEETEGENIAESPILTVSVFDNDTSAVNTFVYSVVQGNFGSDFFAMSTNPDGTGSLKIAKPLDYEDPKQRDGFKLNISVTDRLADNGPKDYATVEVTLVDINDNAPVFDLAHILVSIPENALVGTALKAFKATDPDNRGESKVFYRIYSKSDPKRQFAVNKQTGVVTIQQPLDREANPRHEVMVLAIDDGVPPKTATGTLTVSLRDVNDNYPTFYEDYHPVVLEHTPPAFVIEIRARDPDDSSMGHGSPFKFFLPPDEENPTKDDFTMDFDPSGFNNEGSAKIRSLREFDREKQKFYYMPIVIQDSGTTPMSGTSTLTIEIGDINDNEPFDGKKEIVVFNYKGKLPETPIGQVSIEDPDDNDLEDKEFTWKTPPASPKYFLLDKDSGMLTMKANTPIKREPYIFQVNVYDKKYDKTVTGDVVVYIKEIRDEAVFSSGSLRISGITAEEFIDDEKGESKYNKLRREIARLAGTSPEKVLIFTVMGNTTVKPPFVDVRYAASGSPFYKDTKLDGLMEIARKDVEQNVGINITMVRIDECLAEQCEDGCKNELRPDIKPTLVNAKRTALVAVTAKVVPECVCGARNFSGQESCENTKCYNNGICNDTWMPQNVQCECLRGFDGPRCQQTTRHFNGKGWAWLPPLEQCEISHISLEFITLHSNGLLLYNGPVTEPDSNEWRPTDYMALFLQLGKPVLKLDFGTGALNLEVVVTKELNDGNWHRLDIYWNKQDVRLVVDRCKDITPSETDTNSQQDRSACESGGVTPGFNFFLNVNTPLQLGGIRDILPTNPGNYISDGTQGFNGCIKNLINNGMMYDLDYVGMAVNSVSGCPPTELNCGINTADPQCKNGICLGTFHNWRCLCYPGYYGDRCDKEAREKSFEKDSFIKYRLLFKPNMYSNVIQVRFRTRQNHGLLFSAASLGGGEYSVLEIKNRTLVFRFDLNARKAQEQVLILNEIKVNDGRWHVVRVERYGDEAIMTLDGGDGRKFNETVGMIGFHKLINIDEQNVFIGADVKVIDQANVELTNDYEGCLQDIRFDNEYLPLDKSEDSSKAEIVRDQHIISGCSSGNPCFNFICPENFICVDMWRQAFCMCPPRYVKNRNGSACIDDNECERLPCPVDAECVNLLNGQGYICKCPDGSEGLECNPALAQVLRLSVGALAAILVCIFFLLMLVLVLVIYTRSRRNEKYAMVVDPDDDIRENIINYDDEGAGEDDTNAYDIGPLRIPVDPDRGSTESTRKPPLPSLAQPLSKAPPRRPGDQPDVGDFINDRLNDADNDPNMPPHDDYRNYAYEGGGSTAGSLSSLASGTDDDPQDFDYLTDWGPRFQKLADMYGQGDEED